MFYLQYNILTLQVILQVQNLQFLFPCLNSSDNFGLLDLDECIFCSIYTTFQWISAELYSISPPKSFNQAIMHLIRLN